MAENDGKIYITISNRKMGSGGEQPSAPEEKKEKDSGSILKDYAKDQFFHVLRASATKAVNYAISNYGNFTGDYHAQRQLEDAKSIVNSAIGFGSAFAAGFAVGGPYGVITGLIAVTAKATVDVVGFAGQEALRYREVEGQNYQIAQLRKLSGLNPLLDGSRGTQD